MTIRLYEDALPRADEKHGAAANLVRACESVDGATRLDEHGVNPPDRDESPGDPGERAHKSPSPGQLSRNLMRDLEQTSSAFGFRGLSAASSESPCLVRGLGYSIANPNEVAENSERESGRLISMHYRYAAPMTSVGELLFFLQNVTCPND